MNKRQQYRGNDGAIIHGPECMAPGASNLTEVCLCEFVRPHEFIPQNPHFAPERFARGECHECGHQDTDPVHRPPYENVPWRGKHDLDEDSVCRRCGFDAAEWWHLERQKPKGERQPQPECTGMWS